MASPKEVFEKAKLTSKNIAIDAVKSLPEDGKIKTTERMLSKGVDKATETYKGMKELGGKLAEKGKKMLSGKDVSEGLK